ncbi:MAG: PH domain-containing protein [Candidatus Didemnitutus sp.]|nr:PH domain-containing protein [Candidatus Didemnitutus sp.]
MLPDRPFRSRIDLWLVILLMLAVLAPVAAAIGLHLQGESKGVWLLAIWGTLVGTLVAILSFPLRYTLRADRLHLQSGLLQWDVLYRDMRSAAKSINPLAAPAWSLLRVKIVTIDGSLVLISPDDRDAFLAELRQRCPHLTDAAAG